jgi:hypothetical protein
MVCQITSAKLLGLSFVQAVIMIQTKHFDTFLRFNGGSSNWTVHSFDRLLLLIPEECGSMDLLMSPNSITAAAEPVYATVYTLRFILNRSSLRSSATGVLCVTLGTYVFTTTLSDQELLQNLQDISNAYAAHCHWAINARALSMISSGATQLSRISAIAGGLVA